MKFTVTKTYRLVWELDFAPEYKFTQWDACVNTRTGKMLQRIDANGCIGYKIRKKFYSMNTIHKHMVRIKRTHKRKPKATKAEEIPNQKPSI